MLCLFKRKSLNVIKMQMEGEFFNVQGGKALQRWGAECQPIVVRQVGGWVLC